MEQQRLEIPTQIDGDGFGESNPFRMKNGVCPTCGPESDVLLYYCWPCGGHFCWDHFKEHRC